jgi:WD repeat-containing protein 61
LAFVVSKYSVLHKQEQAHDDGIWCVAWRRNTEHQLEHIVTGSSDDTAKAWKWNDSAIDSSSGGDTESGHGSKPLTLRYIFDGHSLGLVSVDIDSAGSVAASSSLDSHIRLWDLESGSQLQTIDCTPVDSWTVAFSPDGKQIGTGSHFGKVNLYCTERGVLLNSLDAAGKFTLTVAFVSWTLAS